MVLATDARLRTIYDKKGLTPVGAYYYDRTGVEAPKKLDFTQDAVRKGRSQYIKRFAGTQKKLFGTMSAANGS